MAVRNERIVDVMKGWADVHAEDSEPEKAFKAVGSSASSTEALEEILTTVPCPMPSIFIA